MFEEAKNRGRPPGRSRLDVLLVERGLAGSQEQAQRLIMAGKVLVEGHEKVKPGQQISSDAKVAVQAPEKYVSRGGLKLEKALQDFGVDPTDLVCADIGASTGGFTDCLLQHGAAIVYAVDVGKSQMHQRIKEDPRVVLAENANARELRAEQFESPPQLFAVDVSFISLTKVLSSLAGVAAPGARCIALVKPQFEAQREEVSRGKGVIKDPAVHRRVLESIVARAPDLGWHPEALISSPIHGGSGNREFLLLLALGRPASPALGVGIDIDEVVQGQR